ncbi:MAG TPA: LacI family DNA-binding transcriptional regulator [Terrimesophilobacter sp.]|nr:LacI family DNA-binding transcriptional regulator [Terrimesophilobacter sp.]
MARKLDAAPRPTVYDVASRAGVSIATVSRVYRGPERVSENSRRAVERAARELGYVPSASARGLAAGRSGIIGLCFPDFDSADDPLLDVSDGAVVVRDDPRHLEHASATDLYLSRIVQGVLAQARRSDPPLMVAVSTTSGSAQPIAELAGYVDGLITLSQTISANDLAQIARRIPVVVVAGPRMGDSFDHVTTQNHDAMRSLTSHLIDIHGIRELAYLGGPEDSPDDEQRFQGFGDALVSAGLARPDAPLDRGLFTRRGGHDAVRRLVRAGRLPRALVCGNDQMALAALEVLADEGFRVPDDVIVTGFDGLDAAELSSPRLTTVQQPILRLGHIALDLITDRLREPDRPPRSVVLGAEVLVRESCGCHPSDPGGVSTSMRETPSRAASGIRTPPSR